MAETGNIAGTVVDNKDAPIQGATVTLIGVAEPQAQATDAQGQFHFDNLPPGTYEISAVLKGRHPTLQSDVVITADQTTPTKITMNVEETHPPSLDEASETTNQHNRSTYLSPLRKPIVQNTTLTIIGVVFAIFLYKGFGGIGAVDLSNDSSARGIITYLVSFGTIMIAMLLVLSVILGNGGDLKERFALGKEVFTVLIGVLGTVMGFYYGSTVKPAIAATEITQPSAIQITGVKFNPDQPSNGTIAKLDMTITGGVPWYTYSIKFDKDVIEPIENQTSADGKIVERDVVFKKADAGPGEVSFTIEGKDSKGVAFKSTPQKVIVK